MSNLILQVLTIRTKFVDFARFKITGFTTLNLNNTDRAKYSREY